MNSDSTIIDETSVRSRTSPNYSRSQNAQQSPIVNQDERGQMKPSARKTSGTPGTFSVIYEVPTDANDTGITFAPPPSASSSNFNQQQQQHRRSTATGPFERQLSIIDPMSDRVSTILVWKNLIVSTREDKKKQFFQRLRGKAPEPKTKRLLHNVSGAITGGLWAVMGKFSFFS
jgi:hypothetical protein